MIRRSQATFQQLETFHFIGICFEGFFWGLYTAIFAMYIQHYISKEDTSDKKKKIIFCSHCALYILSVATLAFDLICFVFEYFHLTLAPEETNVALSVYYLIMSAQLLYGSCNFLSQSILIYRCWIVWGCNIYVVIIPSILTLAFLPIWLTAISSGSASENLLLNNKWGWALLSTGFGMSLAVNAIVTGLILFRIAKVYLEVEPVFYERMLNATGGSKFLSIALALIESAIALFALQTILVVCSSMGTTPANEVGSLAIGVHQMLLGIAPTIIQVRVSMGLSFHDGTMLESTSVTELRFASGDVNSTPEAGKIVHRDETIDFKGGSYVEEEER